MPLEPRLPSSRCCQDILPVEDQEVSAAIAQIAHDQGVDCRVETKVDGVEVGTDSVSLTLVKGEESETLEAESLLLAIGVVPAIWMGLFPISFRSNWTADT